MRLRGCLMEPAAAQLSSSPLPRTGEAGVRAPTVNLTEAAA
jgi:hypothetical protein